MKRVAGGVAILLAVLALDVSTADARGPLTARDLPAGPSLDPLAGEGATLRERDFAEDPALLAEAHDLVVFDLEPASRRGGKRRDNLARYRLEHGTYRLCLDADEAHVVRLVLEDARGRRVAHVERPPRGPRHRQPRRQCAEARVTAGVHHLRVVHDATTIARGTRLAFVRLAAPEPPLVGLTGRPLGGLWALHSDPTQDPRRRTGRVAAPPPARSIANTPFSAIRPLVVDVASLSIDDSALLDLARLDRPLVGPSVLDLAKIDASGSWHAFADDGPTANETFFQAHPLVVTSLGANRLTLGVTRGDGSLANFFATTNGLASGSLAANVDHGGADPAAARFTLLLRFFPDGLVDTLEEGEVAIYQECNYRGKAAVFRANTPDFGALTSSVTTLERTAASIRLGNNTAVYLNSGPAYTGTRVLLTNDTPCLQGTPIGAGNVASILIAPIAPNILLSTKKCEGCRLVGVDLSGIDLAGVDLEGADLTGANLAGTSLRGVRLRGATLDRVTGLAGGKHSQANLSNASLRHVDMTNVELYGAQLNQADLEGSNLSGAFLSNNPAAGILQAASLIGAHLKNVNLARAHLSGANFSSASFYGSAAAGTGRCAWTSDAPNCATAAGATMNNTQFGGAYLYGVDLTSSIVQGVQFEGAVLIGANLSGATVSVDPNVGTNTGFSGALLQGANLAPASLTGTTLFNAFLDFRPEGNAMYLRLSESFANFPNWHRPGEPICVLVLYDAPSTVPTGNTTLTCPDGTSGTGAGCGLAAAQPPLNPRWASSLDLAHYDPPGSYLEHATYTPAATTPVCTDPDLDW